MYIFLSSVFFLRQGVDLNSASMTCLCFALYSFAGIRLAVRTALSVLTLGSDSQGVRQSLGLITVCRVRTFCHVLDFIFVYTEFHLLFCHLDAGNLSSL